jgi:hypothetical protein
MLLLLLLLFSVLVYCSASPCSFPGRRGGLERLPEQSRCGTAAFVDVYPDSIKVWDYAKAQPYANKIACGLAWTSRSTTRTRCALK